MAIGRGIYKYLAAEHVLFVYNLASGLSSPTKTQYIERRIAKDLGVESYTETTCLTNKSSPDYDIQVEIQRQSTMWMLYITLCIQFPVLILSNIWGGISDRYGRHILCAIPCIGLILNYVISAIVVVFELPLAVFLAGSLIVGLSGDLTLVVTGCAGYISDVTLPKSKERTTRFALIDISFTMSNSLIQFAIGYVISLYGFAAPFYVGIVLIAICGCCIIFCLPDRRAYASSSSTNTAIQTDSSSNEKAPKNPINVFRNVYRLFKSAPGRPSGRGWRLCAFNFIICASIMLIVANADISVLYTTGQPFCLNPVQEGHYGAAMFAVFTGGKSAVEKLAKNCVLFAFSGCLCGLAAFVTPLIFNAIYSSTLHFMPGFVYFVMAAVGIAAWLVILILHVKEPRGNQHYQQLHGDDLDGLPSSCPDDDGDGVGREEVGLSITSCTGVRSSEGDDEEQKELRNEKVSFD
ncbi:proton-coupled folate transporter-like [Acanthaster planci]|uniref:Proton-coupled folate transporter n=1 Tax=Acanthaster planci TaxID=133434 RepID=A0A8B7ZRS1_ACAPL|nr:proton-coupled folate transporter-like [Acanthaster planci]